jgi:arginyl-tRNA synthetase
LEQLKSREKEVNKEEGEKEGEKEHFTSLKPEEYEDAAEKLGIASIKYYDLKQNRISAYAFNYDKMLDPRGNTATYLIYAYVRMCSIIRKAGIFGVIQALRPKPLTNSTKPLHIK